MDGLGDSRPMHALVFSGFLHSRRTYNSFRVQQHWHQQKPANSPSSSGTNLFDNDSGDVGRLVRYNSTRQFGMETHSTSHRATRSRAIARHGDGYFEVSRDNTRNATKPRFPPTTYDEDASQSSRS